jgi:hypothetical protein
MTAIIALTAQNTLGVTGIQELPPAFVRAQIDAVLDDIGADAAKTGMLFSAPLIEAVADALAPRNLPLVVDPVMVASSGSRLLREDAIETLIARLFPLAAVVTPNLPEAQALAVRRPLGDPQAGFGEGDCYPRAMVIGRAACSARAARSRGSLVRTMGLGQVLANAATTASVAVIVAGRPVAVRSRAASRACGSVTSRTWQARSSRLAWKSRR